MRILLLSQYYWPEDQISLEHELALGLLSKGHQVTVLTAFPHYPKGRVYDGYRGRVFQTEIEAGIKIVRTFVYATPSKNFYQRILNFGSFCISSLIGGLLLIDKPDVVYVWLPPLPLGIIGAVIARWKKSRLVVHVQDIYPKAAVQHGILRNRRAIFFFEEMEKWIYQRADILIGISEGFREHFMRTGVNDAKIHVVENWANADFIVPGPQKNSFRNRVNKENHFMIVYSGGINNNANLEPLIHAADALKEEPFLFIIIGEGQYKERIRQMVTERSLQNVQLLTWQPLKDYPEVLRAADINVVTLSSQSAETSVPSKVYKQLAAGRPIIAITPDKNELFRLVTAAQCGICIPPDDAQAVVRELRWSLLHPHELREMSFNARAYFEQHHTLQQSLGKVNLALKAALNAGSDKLSL
jgi:colanic acid biosynthesis glycosyl transferase WcaI